MSTFGTATIQSPSRRSRKGPRFDCGTYGNLSVKEISRIAGVTREAVWSRIRTGVSGEDLCKPRQAGHAKLRQACRNPVVVIAMKLARAFPDEVPSLDAIRKVSPMCERNAMRWRQALAGTRASR